MLKKMILYIGSNFFLYMLVNFFLSVIFYMILGNKLGFDTLVGVSLGISGGAWSYLAIKHNEVKEFRSEYIGQVKDVESAF